MILLVFSVRDTKVGAYTAPFLCRTRGEAIRSFTDACSDEKLPFKAHPADYELWFVGSFDDAMCTYDQQGCPQRVIGADELG